MTTSGPSEQLLRGWVSVSLALTRRAVATLPEDGPDVPAPALDAEKVVGEALLLLRTARVAGTSEPAWRMLYDDVLPLARPESLPASLCLDPARALDSAFAHIQLSALGNGDAELDLLLELALAEPACGPEQSVIAALHQEWLQRLRTSDPDVGGLATMLARSSLGRPVDVLRCTTQDGYVLTHAIMHGTDLGSWSIPLPRPVHELLADLDALLGVALDADNLDLTAELLWSWPMLRLPPTPASRFAFEVLIHAHDEHGFLPGPGFDPSAHAALPAAERDGLRAADVVPRDPGVRHALRRHARHRHTTPDLAGESRAVPTAPRAARRGACAHLAARRAQLPMPRRPGPECCWRSPCGGPPTAATCGGPPPPGAGPRARPGRRPGGAPVRLAVAARYGSRTASADRRLRL